MKSVFEAVPVISDTEMDSLAIGVCPQCDSHLDIGVSGNHIFGSCRQDNMIYVLGHTPDAI